MKVMVLENKTQNVDLEVDLNLSTNFNNIEYIEY